MKASKLMGNKVVADAIAKVVKVVVEASVSALSAVLLARLAQNNHRTGA